MSVLYTCVPIFLGDLHAHACMSGYSGAGLTCAGVTLWSLLATATILYQIMMSTVLLPYGSANCDVNA